MSAKFQSFKHTIASIASGDKLHRFLLTTLPPALKAASDATVLTGTVNTSRAIIDNTGYFICCFFHHSKISKSSLSSNGIVSTLRYLSISVVLFGELVVAFFLLLNISKGLLYKDEELVVDDDFIKLISFPYFSL